MRISPTAFRNTNLIFQEPASSFGRRLRGQMPASKRLIFRRVEKKKEEGMIEENVIFQVVDGRNEMRSNVLQVSSRIWTPAK